MELWTGALYWWKCHRHLKSAGLFPRNISWTPLKPQYSNPNPNPLANLLLCIDFLTPPTPLIIPHRLPATLESFMPLKNWYLVHSRCSKTIWSIPYVSVAFFPSLKQNYTAYRFSKVSDSIFEIHQQWQLGFCRVYYNCCCSCWFEPEIIKIRQSFPKIQKHREFSRFNDNFICLYKKSLETYWMHHVYGICQGRRSLAKWCHMEDEIAR